ncbi:hypothetical protein [Paraburkholderia sp. SIMBA_054]|uniref:hypothetical protein n=1 Tax=Paraburkholderia sp. SIMBA_054 TaxID=3085795 RepID=UPI00397AAB5A
MTKATASCSAIDEIELQSGRQSRAPHYQEYLMKVLGVSLRKPDPQSVLAMLVANSVVFAILMAIDRAINKHIDLPFIGLVFAFMISYRVLELVGISQKEAGWRGFALQVTGTALVVLGCVAAFY